MVGFFFLVTCFLGFFLLVLGGLKSGWWHASADGNVSQFTALIQTEISQNNRWMDWREILCRRSCSPEDESDRLSWSCNVFLEQEKLSFLFSCSISLLDGLPQSLWEISWLPEDEPYWLRWSSRIRWQYVAPWSFPGLHFQRYVVTTLCWCSGLV